MNFYQGTNFIFYFLLVVYVAIRGHFMKSQKFSEVTECQVDERDRKLQVGMALSVIVIPVVYSFTPVLWFADYDLPVLVRLSGLLMLMVSLFIFYYSHHCLGANWSPSLEVRKDHQLVTQGIYSRVRHPMYSSIWLWCVGQGLALPNWLVGWLPLCCFAVMYCTRIAREEQLMVDRFGEVYEAYQRQTGRLWPRWRKG